MDGIVECVEVGVFPQENVGEEFDGVPALSLCGGEGSPDRRRVHYAVLSQLPSSGTISSMVRYPISAIIF